jgi:hypothetical protein
MEKRKVLPGAASCKLRCSHPRLVLHDMLARWKPVHELNLYESFLLMLLHPCLVPETLHLVSFSLTPKVEAV